MRTNARLAQKRAQIRAKTDGTPVTIKFKVWPNGKPTVDPTTGSAIPDDPEDAPVEKTCVVKGFVHSVAPAQYEVRSNSEIQSGDVIFDWPGSIWKVTAAGDTDLNIDDYLDGWDFAAIIRALDSEEDPATATQVQIESLEDVSFVINGETYVQKPIGENLLKSWDVVQSGIQINRSMLLRRA